MANIAPLDHISYSHLHLLACPYAAFLRYEAKVRGESSPWLVLGNVLHDVLEMAHKEDLFSLPEWVKTFRTEYNSIINDQEIFVSYPLLKKLENEGIEMLELYHGQIENGTISKYPLAVEKDFSIPISGTKLVGRIDKTERTDSGTLRVIDYKSGKKKPDAWSLNNNLQLTAYYWAGFELYGEWPDELVWHHLRTGEQLVTYRTQKDVDNLKKMIDNAVKMRNQGIRHRIYNDAVCGDGSGRGISCDYRGAVCDDTGLEEATVERLMSEGSHE